MFSNVHGSLLLLLTEKIYIRYEYSIYRNDSKSHEVTSAKSLSLINVKFIIFAFPRKQLYRISWRSALEYFVWGILYVEVSFFWILYFRYGCGIFCLVCVSSFKRSLNATRWQLFRAEIKISLIFHIRSLFYFRGRISCQKLW